MKTQVLPSVTLFFTDPSQNSDKTYSVQIEPSGDLFVVNAQNGKRGGTQAFHIKTARPVSLDKATEVYNDLVEEKKAKGYTEDESGEPFAPTPAGRRKPTKSAGMTPVPQNIKTPAVSESGEREFGAQLLNFITEEEAERYITDDDYMGQEKKNGHRVSVKNTAGIRRGFNKLGKERPLPKPVAEDIPDTLDIHADGELIGDVEWLFDLLSLGGTDLRKLSALERIEALELLGLNSKNLKTIKTARTTAEKRAMFDRLKANKAEGMVFKLKSAPYTAGRPTKGGPQVKCPFRKQATLVVTKVNAKRSVAVAVLDDSGRLIPMGNVSIPPNKTVPPVGARVEIRYLYCLKGGSLVQPNFIEDRSDEIVREECVETQIVYTDE
jgi:bifunctional non-homologous end joining protein LigD